MLILEIALGVVLGVLILRYWPFVVGVGVGLGVLLVVVGLVLAAALGVLLYFEKFTREEFVVWLWVVLFLASMWLVLDICIKLLQNKLANSNPRLDALIRGHPPYDTPRSRPARWVVVGLLGAGATAVVLFALLIVVSVVIGSFQTSITLTK